LHEQEEAGPGRPKPGTKLLLLLSSPSKDAASISIMTRNERRKKEKGAALYGRI
jgi:hypothetical protein